MELGAQRYKDGQFEACVRGIKQELAANILLKGDKIMEGVQTNIRDRFMRRIRDLNCRDGNTGSPQTRRRSNVQIECTMSQLFEAKRKSRLYVEELR